MEILTDMQVTTNNFTTLSQPSDIITGSIKNYLVWPESPIRKGKRNIERMPFVLTSEKWKTLQSEKREKKISEEKNKEERK